MLWQVVQTEPLRFPEEPESAALGGALQQCVLPSPSVMAHHMLHW